MASSLLLLVLSIAAGAPAVATSEPPITASSWWVANHTVTPYWSDPGPGAEQLGVTPPWSLYLVIGPQRGDRLPVWNPRTGERVWLEAAALGPIDAPPAEYYRAPEFSVREAVDLPARLVGAAPIYARPWQRDFDLIERGKHNQPVRVVAAVEGENGSLWYQLGPERYVPAESVRVPRPVDYRPGRWIDADLNEPVLVTAYEDGVPVYAALAVKGTQAYRTPVGEFRILRRVENETMDSVTIGIPRDAPGGYYLKDVLYTQYFTWDGASLHYNYWRSSFGYAGSHGCLGMNYEDSRWFWTWATVGTPIRVSY